MPGETPESGDGRPPAPKASSDVFVSYASQDAAVADAVVAALERHGVKCWVAPRDVTPGEFYADAIVGAINATRLIVVVLTGNSVGSPHVLREIERASAKRHPVVSFRIDTIPLPAGLEYFLSASHWLDATVSGIDSALPRLVEAAQRLLAPAAAVEPGHKADTAKPLAELFLPRLAAKPARAWLTRPIVATVAVIVVVAAYLGLGKLGVLKHAASDLPVAAVTPATTPAAPPISDKSIAVLPFVDMSEKKDQEYFGDGMAEEVLDLLAKIPGLTVIGRTSSFQFKGKNEDLRAIGTKLNAAHVLEGSVRKSGDQIRITAQLINTRTGAHEWSETYNRHIGDVLKLQDAIAGSVVREMQLTVAPGYLNSRSTVKNSDAYDLMLRGRHAADRWDKEGLDEAVTLFQRALDRDATNAEAAAELAYTYEAQGEENYLAPTAAFEQARRAAAMALKLDPRNARAHFVLGLVHVIYDWDWAAAEREFHQVAIRAPGSADALIGEGLLSLALGRWDDALRHMKAALAQDPLRVTSFYYLADVQIHLGHLPEAEAAMRRALDIRPTYDWGHWLLGLILLARGNHDAALLEMQQVTAGDGRQGGLAMAYFALGRRADSDSSLAQLIKEHADDAAYLISTVYAFRGQADEAMHWLERAYAQRDSSLYYVKVELRLKSLEMDPRYKAFLRKMNLPE